MLEAGGSIYSMVFLEKFLRGHEGPADGVEYGAAAGVRNMYSHQVRDV